MGEDINASLAVSSSATSGIEKGGTIAIGDLIVGGAKKIPQFVWLVFGGGLLAFGLVWLVTRD